MNSRMNWVIFQGKLCKFCKYSILKYVLDDQNNIVAWDNFINKTLGRARDPRANGAWLSKLTE